MTVKERLIESLFKFLDVIINGLSNIDILDILLIYLVFIISNGTAPPLFLEYAYEWIGIIVAFLVGRRSEKTLFDKERR